MRSRQFDIVLLVLILPSLWWVLSPWFIHFNLLSELGPSHLSVKAAILSFLVFGRSVYLLLMPPTVTWLVFNIIWDKFYCRRGNTTKDRENSQ